MVDKRFYKHLGPISLVNLIDGLNVEIPEGQFCDIQINAAAPVNSSGAGDISYFDSKKTNVELDICGAEACFVHEDNAHLVGQHNSLAIISKYPRADFAIALSRLYRAKSYGNLPVALPTNISLHKSVVLGAGAKIGQGTTIGPNSVIGPGVEIGENCTIGANVVVEYACIGNNCVIQHGTIIGGNGFGVAKGAAGGIDIPHVGRAILGNNVSLGCLVTIDRAMFGDTIIGDGCKFDNLVQIGHNTIIGAHCMFAAQVGIAGSCVVGSGVMMGGKVGVADHLTIGDGVSLLGASKVMHNIPTGETWSGFPAQPVRQHMREVGALRKLVGKKKKT